jgi:hypothetical protein
MPDNYIFLAMNDKDAAEVAGWSYDGPYSFYNMSKDPEDLEDLEELLDSAARAEGNYFSALASPSMELAGFICFRVYQKAGFAIHTSVTVTTNGNKYDFYEMRRDL